MHKNTKVIIGVIIAILVVAGIWYGTNRKPAENGTIKIGAIYILSGADSDLGKAFQEGTDIAVKEINANGGINGKKIEMIYEDAPDASGKAAVNAAQKLIEIDKAKVVLDMPYSGLGSIQLIAEKIKFLSWM